MSLRRVFSEQSKQHIPGNYYDKQLPYLKDDKLQSHKTGPDTFLLNSEVKLEAMFQKSWENNGLFDFNQHRKLFYAISITVSGL